MQETMQETAKKGSRNKAFRTGLGYLEVELIHLKDKSRFVTAPEPDQYIVQITSKQEGSKFVVVLRRWDFSYDVPGLTRSQSNQTNYKAAKQHYEELRWKLGGSSCTGGSR